MDRIYSSFKGNELRKTHSSPQLTSNGKGKSREEMNDAKLGKVSNDVLPPPEFVEQEFGRIVKDFSLPPEKIKMIQNLPNDKKWLLLKQYRSSSDMFKADGKHANTFRSFRSQQEYIEVLSRPMDASELAKELTSLEVALRTLAISWVEGFIDMNGLEVLLRIGNTFSLKSSYDKPNRDVQAVVIRSLGAIMNNSFGLRAVMRRSDGITTLMMTYDCDNIGMKGKVLELLGGVCLISQEGHQAVMNALSQYQNVKLEQFRFQTIVRDFHHNDFEFQTTAMAFLSAVVNSPEELEVRINLRTELINLGINSVIQDLRAVTNSEILQSHLDTFETEAEADFADLAESAEALHDADMHDPSEVFASIQESIEDPNGYQWLLRLLQQILLLISGAGDRGPKFLQLLTTLTKEVIEQRHGIRTKYQNLNFNLGKMIEGFETQDKVEDLRAELQELNAKASSYGKDMREIQELLDTKEEQIRQLTEELDSSRAASKQAESDLKTLSHKMEIQVRNFQELKLENSRLATAGPSKIVQAQPVPVSAPAAEVSADASSERREPVVAAPPAPPAPTPPPPPPIAANMITEYRLKVKASSRMKQMNWTKIPDNMISSTIWKKIGNDGYIQDMLDFEELESSFNIAASPTKKDSKSKMGSSDSLTKVKYRQTITVLDPKKAYALSILLGRIRMSLSELRIAVLQMADEKFNEMLLKQLQAYIPTKDEVSLLSENLEYYEQLGIAEQFYIEVMKINRYEQRLRSLALKRKFLERLSELRPMVEAVQQASSEVRESRGLQQVLEIILTIGNFMNGTTLRGNAYGFKLSAIARLAEIKSNNKGTILNYICRITDKQFPELKNLMDDFPHLEKASRVTKQQIDDEFNELKTSIDFVKDELELHRTPSDPSDKFHAVMNAFLQQNTGPFDSLQQSRYAMFESFRETLQYFGEDPSLSPDEFFSMIYQFLQQFERARKENEKEIAIAVKAEQIKKAETLRLTTRKNKQQQLLSGKNRGVMDELISSLKNGTFIQQNATHRRQYKRMSKMIEGSDDQAEKMLSELRTAYNINPQ